MPRAKNKEEMNSMAKRKFAELNELVGSLTDKELGSEFDFSNDKSKTESHWKRDKNLRDVLVHLHEWHVLLLKWVEANTSGVPASFLPEEYNWKTYPQMNVEFFNKHQKTPLEKAKDLLYDSHAKVMELAEKFSDDELFVKKHFDWIGTSNLGSYFISTTSSHYDWAIKKLKAHRKALSMKP
ncbi:MAG TPA: hypothetical protein DCO86_01125 [Spirochaetaceae bacterium]|nr:hypothetical protein [Spirochaetaceae bacterium]